MAEDVGQLLEMSEEDGTAIFLGRFGATLAT